MTRSEVPSRVRRVRSGEQGQELPARCGNPGGRPWSASEAGGVREEVPVLTPSSRILFLFKLGGMVGGFL